MNSPEFGGLPRDSTALARIVTVMPDDGFRTENTETMVDLSSPNNPMFAVEPTANTFDEEIQVPSVSISDASVAEGNAYDRGNNARTTQLSEMKFDVTLSTAHHETVSINFATSDGTANMLDGDYRYNAGTVTFNPGETSKTITVTIVGDNEIEGDEVLTVNLLSSVNASISDGSGTGTITGDDSGVGGEDTEVFEDLEAAPIVAEASNSFSMEIEPRRCCCQTCTGLRHVPSTEQQQSHNVEFRSDNLEETTSELESQLQAVTVPHDFKVLKASASQSTSPHLPIGEWFELAGAVELEFEDSDQQNSHPESPQSVTHDRVPSLGTVEDSNAPLENVLDPLLDQWFEQW